MGEMTVEYSAAFQSALEEFPEDDEMKEAEKENVPINIAHRLSNMKLNKKSSSAKTLTTTGKVMLSEVMVPQRILKLSNLELREKLLTLGERPGPINEVTRSAYQSYLAKIQAGIQPSGNSGYRGKHNSVTSI